MLILRWLILRVTRWLILISKSVQRLKDKELSKCTLYTDTRGTKVRHIICCTSVPESKISISFSLRPAGFELQDILRCVHWLTPKWPRALQGQKVPHICVTSVPNSQMSLRPAIFKLHVQAILRQLHRMTPKWSWTLQGQKYRICVSLVFLGRKFQCVALRPSTYEIYEIQGCQISQMRWMTSDWPWTFFTVKNTLYTLNITSRCPTTSPFQDITDLIIRHWLLC